MMDFIIYDVKVAVILAVFYMFYRLLLSKETFHRLNRVMLLCTAVGSLLLPLFHITIHRTVEVEASLLNMQISEGVLPMIEQTVVTTPWWQILLSTLFILGALAVLIQILISVYTVLRIISGGERRQLEDGTWLVITEKDVSPFSWMHTIVLSRKDYEDDHAAIISHEQAHIRLCHSWDLLLVDLVSLLQWFNPAIWMLRADLCAVHEYEADAQVLDEGYNVKQYQYLLVKKAVGMSGYSVANSFNHRELKSRITMMCRKKSSRSRVLRVLYFLPLIGVCLAVNARTQVNYVEKQTSPSDKVTNVSQILQESGEISSLVDTLKKEKTKVEIVVRDTLIEKPAGVYTNDNDDGKVKIKILSDGSVKVVNPLVIVDGERVEDINDIDPNITNSFQVLKDEDAIKVYGDEGKNGVIIIETKNPPKDYQRYTVDDIVVPKSYFDKVFAAGYAEVGRKTDEKTGVATAYIYTKEGGKAEQPKTKVLWIDADGNDVLFGGDKYAWKKAKAQVTEDLQTGDMTVLKIKGIEVDGKRLSDAELQVFTTDDTLMYYVTDDGILTVMTSGYLKQKAAGRNASQK